MQVCIAGPMSLDLIKHPFDNNKLPIGYPFPPMAGFVNAFLKKGHKVIAVTYSMGIEKPITLESENITICIAKRRTKHAARDIFKEEINQLVDFYNSYKVDVISSHWSYEFSLAALKTNKNVHIRLHDYPPLIFRLNPHPYKLIRMLIHYNVVAKAHYLNCNSEYTFSLLPKRIKSKTRVIPNFFANEIKDLLVKQKENNIICVSSGFHGRKNVASLLKAFKYIKHVIPNIKLLLIGSEMGIGEAAFKYANNNKLLENVEFLGMQSYEFTLSKVANSLIMVHPSLEESFGMSVLESMILKTVVIGGLKSGNIPFLLKDGQCGVLCDVSNPKDIASKVLDIIQNSRRRILLENEAYEYANYNYSEDAVIDKFIDLFQSN